MTVTSNHFVVVVVVVVATFVVVGVEWKTSDLGHTLLSDLKESLLLYFVGMNE